MVRNLNVFISHSWDHSVDLRNLQQLLHKRQYFNVSFEEVPQHEPINSGNAAYIKTRLSDKIRNSNIVLGLAGIYASHSPWMQWELERASQLGIPIVGVIPQGRERISKAVYDLSIVDVRWNTESIVSAIRQHAL